MTGEGSTISDDGGVDRTVLQFTLVGATVVLIYARRALGNRIGNEGGR